MKITHIRAVAVLTAIGLKLADKYDQDQLNAKMNALAKNVDDDDIARVKDAKTQADLKAVLKALAAEDPIEVAPKVEEAEAEEEAPAPKAKGKGKPAPAAEEEAEEAPAAPKGKGKPAPAAEEAEEEAAPAPKKKAAPKAAAETDAFGNREGSQAATINAALSKKPQTVEQIAAKTKMKNARVKSHLKYLLEKKLVKEAPEGSYATK